MRLIMRPIDRSDPRALATVLALILSLDAAGHAHAAGTATSGAAGAPAASTSGASNSSPASHAKSTSGASVASPASHPAAPTAAHVSSTRHHAPATHATPAPAATPSHAGDDSSFTLKGGQEGTVFRSLTVEGEDRIHYDFERPPVMVALDPASAPGLDWGTARDVLDRTRPDAAAPLVAASTGTPVRGLAEPWRQRFASGDVARFRPAVTGVSGWKLTVADAHGQTVVVFEGHGEPPSEIAWDGHTISGDAVTPGLTYSYVFEAVDRAGNKRHFLGDPFQVNAFRMDTPAGPVLAFSGRDLMAVPDLRSGGADQATPALVAEAAGWLNRSVGAKSRLRVTATARTRDQADRLAALAQRGLNATLLGDPARLSVASDVRADAPADGAVRIGPTH
jgi:hypothetical protein